MQVFDRACDKSNYQLFYIFLLLKVKAAFFLSVILEGEGEGGSKKGGPQKSFVAMRIAK
jgi:hypothetical protein